MMSWIGRRLSDRRRPGGVSPTRMVEVLEDRTLLADGITPSPGAPINAVAGVPITAIFATYTISDPSGEPGTQWRAHIDFGDGQSSKQDSPVPDGNGFDFNDTHTYTAPGTYTATVMIAVPGSHNPNANTITTHVTVSAPPPPTTPSPTTPSPTPTTPTPTTPLPTPTTPPPTSIGPFRSSGLRVRAKAARTFHSAIARFSDPKTLPTQFSAAIDWGDESGSTPGQIKRQGKGRYVVVGTHRYQAPGAYQVTITIRDAAGDAIAANSSVTVTGKKR